MGYGWLDELKKEARARTSEVVAKATERAMYRVQRDLHTKPIEAIAKETGHGNLAQACYCMLTTKGTNIDVEIYYDASFIEGFYKSNSSYHQDGGAWRVVRKNKGLSSYDFWEMHYNGETGGSYGAVEETWIMDNFWNGREYVTNGWPLSKSAEYLSGHYQNTTSAYDVAANFVDQYIADGYYEQYVQEEINNLTR
jgi:hypothetical protein